MATLYVAASKGMQDWAGDVGLGKHVYKVGCIDEGDPAQAVENLSGFSDWKVLLTLETELDEATILERLAKKEKMVDPTYYPKLKGAPGIVKVSVPAVENAILVALAMDDLPTPKVLKVKPADIATYLTRNLLK